MKRNCVIFDLDETLISTAKRQRQVIIDYFKLFGLLPNFTLNEYSFYRRETGKTNFEVFKHLNKFGLEENQFKEFFRKNIESPLYLTLDTLIVEIDKLSQYKANVNGDFIILSLRSNSDSSIKQLADLGLINLFDKVFFKEHSNVENPKVQNLIDFKKEYASLTFIGDSKSDYIAANDAKVNFVKVNTSIINFEYEGISYFNINKYLENQIYGV